MLTKKELETKTIEELAVLAERNHPESAEGILLREEIKSRTISSSSVQHWYAKPGGLILLGVVASLIAGGISLCLFQR